MKNKNKVFPVVFGLIFFLVGLGFFVAFVPSMLWNWQQMKGWQSVNGQLINAHVKTSRTDDGYTYQALAEYKYQVNNKWYKNNRVALSETSDNISNYHEDVIAQLKKNYHQYGFITIWVDPYQPNNAILFRDLRWELLLFQVIFSGIFMLVGMGVIWFGLIKSPAIEKSKKDQQWWQKKEGWEDNKVKSQVKLRLAVCWFFALVWNGISLAPMLAIPEELAKGNYAILVILIFAVIGVGLIVCSIYYTLEWFKYKTVELVLNPWPAEIGETLEGIVEVPIAHSINNEFSVKIQSVYTYTTGSGKSRTTRHDVKWESEKQIRPSSRVGKSILNFSFFIPEELKQSEPSSSAYHHWKIIILGDVPGIDFNREYDIPVFDQREISLSEDSIYNVSDESNKNEIINNAIDKVMQYEKHFNQHTYRFVAQNKWRLMFPLLVISLITLISGVCMMYVWLTQDKTSSLLLVSSACLFFGVLIFILAVLFLSSKIMVVIDEANVTVLRSFFGVNKKNIFLPGELKRIGVDQGARMQSGTNVTQFYNLFAYNRQDEKICRIGEGFTSKKQAQQAADTLYKKIIHKRGRR